MNIKKIKSKTIATLVSTLFVLTPSVGFAAGVMQDWPVHDQAMVKKLMHLVLTLVIWLKVIKFLLNQKCVIPKQLI